MTTWSPFITSAMTPRDRLNSLIESAASSVQPTYQTLDDGSVVVCLGTTCGTVSSFHLVEPKLNQLKALQEQSL
jgi:hypothetical protein